MPITRWDPLRDALVLQSRLNARFQDASRAAQTPAFVPPVDIYEDEQKITLKLEVPGMNESDLDIQLENNRLTVKGERKFEKEEKEENFHRIERRYGSFYRTFAVPTTVNPDGVKATYDAGVLNIQLEKRAELKPKQIKVGVSPASVEDAKKDVQTAA